MVLLDINDVVTTELSKNAIVRDDFPGFKDDYLVVHCLIKKYKPTCFMEIGTSAGMGTYIISNALGIKRFINIGGIKMYSIDVPPGTNPQEIYPDGEDGHPQKAGALCRLPYKQLFGDSTSYDFSSVYPLEGWFIDGKHNYEYVTKDTNQALKSNPNILIWHDADMKEVEQAIIDVMSDKKAYSLYRVNNTRIAFASKEKFNRNRNC